MQNLLKNANAVNPIGLAVMALGIIIVALAGMLVRKFPEERRENVKMLVKLAGLFVCMAGFLIAILS